MLQIISKIVQFSNFFTEKTKIKKTIQEKTVEKTFIRRISFVNLLNAYLSSLIFAASRVAQLFVPNRANVTKKATMELAKLIFPIPSGARILEAYGKVITGNARFIKDFTNE